MTRLTAGATRLRLINDGPACHPVCRVRLEGGHTLDDLVDRFTSGHPQPNG
jgi:hypothetical protein